MTTALGQVALGAWVASTRRSWWQAGYRDGKVVNEWDTIPGGIKLAVIVAAAREGEKSRWEELPKRGLRSLRLLTPIGRVGHLETDADFRLFQLKVGGTSISAGGGRNSRWQDAHLIGKVINSDGDCELMVFDGKELHGPLPDNVLDLQYKKVGALNLDVLGIRI